MKPYHPGMQVDRGVRGKLCIALMAGLIVADVAGAVHDPDVTDLEFKCQAGTSKADAKFTAAAAKCIDKCIQNARRVPPQNPEADCFPPYGGATFQCLGDPLKGAVVKAAVSIAKACLEVSGKTNCPECYSARNGAPDCAGWGFDLIVNGLSNPTATSRSAQLESLLFIFCDDGGSSQTPAENKCERGLGKTLVKFSGCKLKCYDKCNAAMHAGGIPPGSCNPPSPSDPATFACLFDVAKGCEAKAIASCNKACVTPPADAPECYGFTCASIVSLVETAIDGNVPGTYCYD
jgi:hypothetical protein